MFQFTGTVLIEDGEIKTFQELIQAAIGERDYPTAQAKSDAISRMNPCVPYKCRANPEADVYMLEAFKGVRNGVVIAADWDSADFTAADGGADILKANVPRDLDGRNLGALVIHNASGGDVTILVSLAIN